MACADVPVAWKQLTRSRLHEVDRTSSALTWADADLDARTLAVSKAYERESKGVKAPKPFVSCSANTPEKRNDRPSDGPEFGPSEVTVVEALKVASAAERWDVVG